MLPAAGEPLEAFGAHQVPGHHNEPSAITWARQQFTVTSGDLVAGVTFPTAFAQGAAIPATLPLVLTVSDMSRAAPPAHCTSRSNNNLEL